MIRSDSTLGSAALWIVSLLSVPAQHQLFAFALQWLGLLHCFPACSVDGALLLVLTDEQMQKSLNIRPLGHREALKNKVGGVILATMSTGHDTCVRAHCHCALSILFITLCLVILPLSLWHHPVLCAYCTTLFTA